MCRSVKPTVVMVHGAWHSPVQYEPLPTLLVQAGYSLIFPHLPSIGGKMATFDQDVTAVRDAIHTCVEDGREVVVLMHSYGGVVGSEAAKGLSVEDVQGPGGVIKMIYLTACVVPEGGSMIETGLQNTLPPFIKSANDHQYVAIDCHNTFFADVSKEVADRVEAGFKLQAKGAFESKVTYAAWKNIDSAYICELNKAIPLAAQEAMVAQEGKWVRVDRLPSSHSPFLTMPERTAELVRRVIGENM